MIGGRVHEIVTRTHDAIWNRFSVQNVVSAVRHLLVWHQADADLTRNRSEPETRFSKEDHYHVERNRSCC